VPAGWEAAWAVALSRGAAAAAPAGCAPPEAPNAWALSWPTAAAATIQQSSSSVRCHVLILCSTGSPVVNNTQLAHVKKAHYSSSGCSTHCDNMWLAWVAHLSQLVLDQHTRPRSRCPCLGSGRRGSTLPGPMLGPWALPAAPASCGAFQRVAAAAGAYPHSWLRCDGCRGREGPHT
jgi:hypothetical protein